jgi:hypothetical protein
MPENYPQTLANHPKADPLFHYFVMPVSFLNWIYAAYNLVAYRQLPFVWGLVMASFMIGVVFLVRVYPLKVQNRLIRLEERLRMQALLPPDLNARAQSLTELQLVALRFASDAELAGLIEKTLAEKLPAKEIKKLIQNWRGDYYRV